MTSSSIAVPSHTAVDAAELLMAMLRVPSPSGGEDALAALLVSRLLAAGFDVDVDTVGNIVAAWGDGPRTIALVGHLDTVAGHIDVRRDGDVLHGRGAVDAKGPLAAAIAAVSRQRRDVGVRYIVVGAVEEESTSRGARHLGVTMDAPDGLVILEPSGWDAVTIGYKGSLRMRWRIEQAHAHGAGREPSAADRGIALVRALQDYALASTGSAGPFDRVDVRVLGFSSDSDGLTDHATAEIGVRTPPGCDVDALIDAAHAASSGGELAIVGREPAIRTDRGSALARAFTGAIRAGGGSPRCKLKTGTSDLNILAPAWGCEAVAYGPGNSSLDHTPHERISVTELERAVDVLDRVLGER